MEFFLVKLCETWYRRRSLVLLGIGCRLLRGWYTGEIGQVRCTCGDKFGYVWPKPGNNIGVSHSPIMVVGLC